MRVTAMLLLASSMSLTAQAEPMPPHRPAPVTEYPIHEDGALIYNPLSREAHETGALEAFADVPRTTAEARLGDTTATFHIPKHARAYDLVPMPYDLSRGAAPGPIAIEATAFEDPARRKGRDLYDLALPGRIDVSVELLGSMTGKNRGDRRHNITLEGTDGPASIYPSYERSPFHPSGVAEFGDHVWFLFRYTNTGDTILDPEGMGGFQWHPELWHRDDSGEFAKLRDNVNTYVRETEYVYPGESREFWCYFGAIEPGEYRVRNQLTYRYYGDYETELACTQTGLTGSMLCTWGGPAAVILDQPIRVASTFEQTPIPEPIRQTAPGASDDKITRYIHTHEEFMTAFDAHQAPAETVKGTLYLQVAPWTKEVVVKLISTGPVAIQTASAPIVIDVSSLAVAFQADHPATAVKDGLKVPIIASQAMPGMRTNVPSGPFPELHLRAALEEQRACGVNYFIGTSGPWIFTDRQDPPTNEWGDAVKYYLDMMRDQGVQIEPWTYVYLDSAGFEQIAAWLLDEPLNMEKLDNWYPTISHSDPDFGRAQAAIWNFYYKRWGDTFLQFSNGDVAYGAEDSRGWLRQDFNNRDVMGALTVAAFREWVRAKYETIEKTNAAWGTDFASFDDIEPEIGQKGGPPLYRYNDVSHPFHDWNAAVEDLDIFRTELRLKNYRDTLAEVRKLVPGATICIRNEGGNALVSGIDPHDPDPHMRHIYYGQRRIAALAEVLIESGLVKYHADYTTVPYPPRTLRKLVSMGVEQGIVPIWLPQFDNMRDIAINTKYGTEYHRDYNLPEPRRGQMMHTLAALFPWYKAVYESGGAPGILWEDIQCDGFATETQKREMRLFKKMLDEALSTPQAMQARRATPPDATWRDASRAMRSYTQEAIERARNVELPPELANVRIANGLPSK